MDVQVNYLGVLAAVFASMVIGGVWYSNGVFGKRWRKLAKIDPKREKADRPKAMFSMLLMSGVTAYVLAHVTYLSYSFFGYSYLSSAISTGFWMWLGFVATGAIMLGAFEHRDMKLTGINLGNSLLTFLAMGAAIGLIGL